MHDNKDDGIVSGGHTSVGSGTGSSETGIVSGGSSQLTSKDEHTMHLHFDFHRDFSFFKLPVKISLQFSLVVTGLMQACTSKR
jgi:hypothetical protein